MNLDDLNMLVSETVRRAELLEDLASPSAREAWSELSLIEERLARMQPPESAGGGFARRGAIHAAIKAQNLDRAEALIRDFTSEGETSAKLVVPLKKLVEEELSAFGRRFPFATRQHGIGELRRWSKIVSERRGKPLLVA